MLDRYAEPPGIGGNAHPMDTGELIDYLKDIDDFSVSPWIAVTEKAEAIGDPATPSREHTAVLRWLGKALEIWEKEFPLESRLANQVRRLKPLAAALAVTDARFMTPGAHPLHQLMDTIQARAIGWQSRLDRVGTALEEQITQAVDSSRAWFAHRNTDLKQVCTDFTKAAERDQARAQRMVQRVVETEAGKVRTAAAKQEAARMINANLERFPAPAEIGEFLKGPWYTSAQLLLLKFGVDSQHWKDMSATTESLMDSLQSLDGADETRRQRIFEAVTKLPKEMRRWLLSLHHDTEAVNEAMAMVEFIHLRILRQQAIDLQTIGPIVVEDSHALSGEARHANALKKWSEGQWFLVHKEGSVLRVQLVLKIEQSQQLLFTNMAGLKVLQLSFEAFNDLLLDKKAAPLYRGASFSLCLARAAGVTSVEILDALYSAMSDDGAEPGQGPAALGEPVADTALPDDFLSLEDEPAPRLSGEQTRIEASDGADLPFVEFGATEETAQADTQFGDAHEEDESGLEYVPDLPEFEEDSTPSPEAHAGDTGALSAFERETRRFLDENEAIAADSPPGSANQEPVDEELPENRDTARDAGSREINLPVGVWIGFHDGETPVMARLAVHDPQGNLFIFVNRKGVKVRQVGGEEFLSLIDKGMVEILEASTNFRDVVTEVRKSRDQ